MIRPALALTLAILATPATADTLIDNANGIQVGANGKLEWFTGIVIDDHGKVVQLLHGTDEKRLAHIDRRIDAGGRTLLPGMIDSHGHIMDLGKLAIQLDLTGVQSIDEFKARLAQYAAANPKAPWILGFGWNQELWPERRMPTAADLDAVVSDRPVWLERIDGHAKVGNRLTLKAAGITGATQTPTGGKIEKDAGGQPTGLFIDSARDLVDKVVPSPSLAERDRALAEAQRLLLSYGVTAAANMGTSVDDWATMRRAGDSGTLQVRILSYVGGSEQLKNGTMAKPSPWLYGDRLHQGGIKLYADGALGSRGAWLKQPYTDAPNSRGLQFNSDAELLAMANQAASRGFQIATHAIGDAANAQIISVYEQLGKTYPGDRRWRIEHLQVIDPVDIPRIAKAGIIASMQPTHQTSDRLMAEARLGPNRLAGAYAWRSVLQSGARLPFGSDFPVENPNPFPGLAAAISRQDLKGQPPGGWLPQERVSFETALAGFTREGAYAGFAEDKIGSLDRGKWADFILVDRDPTAVDPQALARTQVIETWVAGRKVWERSATAGGERGK